MIFTWTRIARFLCIGFACALMLNGSGAVRAETVDFDSDLWELATAEIIPEYMGRKCLKGFAYLDGVEFTDGVIEVDVAVGEGRSYPGIVFRMQSRQDYERIFIRPHRSPLYPDAIQYVPVISGIAGWQLYSGTGCTAGAGIPKGEWLHLRLEVSGTQGRLYLGDGDRPALEIHDLKHGRSKGTIGLFSTMREDACFSNFSYRHDANLDFDEPPYIDTPPGVLTDWRLSQAFAFSAIDFERHPGEQQLGPIDWQPAVAGRTGLVDIALRTGRIGREPDCIFAKTTIHADGAERRELVFGYSDAVSIFLNGTLLFSANSSYTSRDPSFLGIVGLFDAVYLPLEEGENELLLAVAESFGGWGFICQDGEAVYRHEDVHPLWESGKDFKIPESIAYDPGREVLYVSNYDGYNRSTGEGGQHISKISLDGTIEAMEWVGGLFNPTGLAVAGDILYAVDRRGLVEIDIPSATVTKIHGIPEGGFLNDAAVGADGTVYVSDSRRNTIFRLAGGAVEEWLAGGEIGGPNGICVHGGELIVGNNGDHCLKAVDIETRAVRTIAGLGDGNIDGVQTDRNGDFIVSHWEGRVLKITPAGGIEKILDTTLENRNCADLAYVAGKDQFFVPTFIDGRVMGFEVTRR